jgi:phosphotransferase system enzyme I (PtsI)
MISSIEELRKAKAILNEVKDILKEKNVAFNEKMEVGIMIEIPSTAVISDLLAKEVDFFSIGTNDLIQYTIAVDRMNSKIANLYNPFHPAILRLIKMTIDNAHREGKWVGMCGEAAGEPKLIPVLLGMGLDEFSMSPVSILRARYIIKQIAQHEMKIMADKILNMATSDEIEQFIEENINIKY